jgi:IclR family mhp operon transcriptional activator
MIWQLSPELEMPAYKPVRSVLRALDVLSGVGQSAGTTITELTQQLKLPKATVIRLLETLGTAGYVTRDQMHQGYRLTDKVYRLTRFQSAPFLIQAFRPPALELSRTFKWPVSIAVLDRDAMTIIYSTMMESPISWVPSGRRLPLLTRALGRAYIANCSDEKRRLIFRMLQQSAHPENKLVRNTRYVKNMIDEVTRQGYAERDPKVKPDTQTTMAVPLIVDDDVVATIGMTYYVAAVRREEAAQRYAPSLRKAAAAIQANLDKLHMS